MALPASRLDELPRRRPPSRRTRRPEAGARRGPARQPSRRREPARLPFLLFSLIVATAMVLLLVSAHALVAQGAFRMSELERSARDLEQEHAELRLELAELSSPERIAKAARKAGLVLPERVEILAVGGKRGPQAPASGSSGTLAIELPGGEG